MKLSPGDASSSAKRPHDLSRRAGRAALGREALGEKDEIEAGPACAGGDQTIKAEKVGRVSRFRGTVVV